MGRYLVASISGGVLFAVLDGALHANPLALRVYAYLRPIARSSVNAPLGAGLDLLYGFVMAALFLLLRPSLPGAGGAAKGLSFAALAWFFRVFMGGAAELVMLKAPGWSIVYSLAAGALEMAAIGLLYGLVLRG